MVFYDPERCRRTYDRSFRTQRLATECARKLELHVNRAGPHSESADVAPRPPMAKPRGVQLLGWALGPMLPRFLPWDTAREILSKVLG